MPAVQTVARVRVADTGSAMRIFVSAAVARDADAVGVVETIAALLTVGALVLRLALVTNRLARLVEGTAARGGDTGARARQAAFSRGSAGWSVEVILALLTAGTLGVALAVQTYA